jgi:hypothetical protein
MTTKIYGLSLLALTLAIMGCAEKTNAPNSKTPAKTTKTENNQEEKHAHGTGPNGGVVFDLGAYHAEFTVDHPKKECYVLILGDDGKTPAVVKATELTLTTKETKTEDGKVVPPMTVTLVPQDADDGKVSKFFGSDPGMGNVADFEGTVVGEIDGKPAQGTFKE